MIVNKIRLRNFRNYEDVSLTLHPKLNIFVGNNAQGKTNILESIVFVSTTRSHRNVNDQEMIRHGEIFASIEIVANLKNGPSSLKSIIYDEGKSLFIQNQPIKKSSDYIGVLNAIVFSPSDLDLFEASPKKRRRFMDFEIGKVSKRYMLHLNTYQKLLKERNALLKESKVDMVYLEVLTKQLIDIQVEVIEERKKFLQALNLDIEPLFKTISEENHQLMLSYKSFVDDCDVDVYEQIKKKYEKSLERDLLFKQTHIGIHRDDCECVLDGYDINSVASQGQKRMIILSMKIALITYIYEIKKDLPILLLDDVLSELDEKKRESLFGLIPKEIQTVITTTDLQDLKHIGKEEYQIFKVVSGTAKPCKEDIV